MSRFLFIFALLPYLMSCGGGASSAPVVEPPDPIQPPLIAEPKRSLARLKAVNEEMLATQIKNGLYYTSGASVSTPTALPVAESDMADTRSLNFSQTVTQEMGVDESDIMKYDGEWLFVATPNENKRIRVLRKQTDRSLAAVAEIALEEEDMVVNGLYLTSEHLSIITKKETYYARPFVEIIEADTSRFSLSILNLSEIESTQRGGEIRTSNTFHFDGNLISSRRIGSKILLFSTYWPNHIQLPTPVNNEQRQSNYDVLSATPISELLPQYSYDGVSSPLVRPDSCFIPEDATELDGYSGIVTLTAIDLNNPLSIQSTCINGMFDGLYAAQDDIVVFGQQYTTEGEHTVLHHFDFANDSFAYNGTVALPGRLDWNQPHLRLSIKDEFLRVVTTRSMQDESDRFDHDFFSISLLAQDRNLPILGRLPNTSQPTELGKPNEDITAVRFFEDNAYIVTFERIDPLYVLDISTPDNPRIVGELEMPGYSSYLMPLNERFLLGIGQNVDPNSFVVNATVSDSMPAPITEGVKVALFDVSSAVPRLVNEVIYDQGATPTEFDYKAITFLPHSAESIRIGLPMQSWMNLNNQWQIDARLELLELNLSGSGALMEHGEIAPQEPSEYGVWQDRAVFDNDDIYYLHHGKVLHSLWSQPNQLIGEY
ncbi:beta-propeller domain-containing protein [Opacimonas viscosa]|uniref:Beta-propeller domain-containing protein n=1 Tax=Opacimonas viscosa TaxID=2961944 RepID=A0AA42BML3_9ALTE|nr:beta-propeller domain-containing protein [Opacimonas viscosa]MCP3429744.1 beta-propeller domain-containing protein [Opacimonas viscosa]